MSKHQIASGADYAPTAETEKVVAPGEFVFASAFLDHGHIHGQTNGLRDAGATLKWAYDPDPKRLTDFLEKNPEARAAESYEQILNDPEVKLVCSAAVPSERAGIGFQAMEAGKDYFTDKSPFTTLDQLKRARELVRQTDRKYMVYYSERLHNEGGMAAGKLIDEGAVGTVLQVINLAPHRLSKSIRPDWFFEKDKYGGILTDIGSHQFEQFLHYTKAADATINFARVENFNNPDKPGLDDFGEASLTADNGASFYCRIDWFTPDGSPVWGDGRTFVVGTEGTLEVRKYMDVAREAPASKIFLVNGKEEQEIQCLENTGFPFFGDLILDCIHRTENAMTQDHAFKAAELSMKAQAMADGVK
ncbi:Gfo/Idh/MocA family protein [Pontiella agarivorans]|uniref:Gfo/Idh/MocA family oxidoreductase n=1 Tax=Pontiella agarivorans TaxID=3038953 RepID=A0ABU5N055_9BACT|nr:Gfo/Idh/MocA family oxidoreductase [Pontiella agarivorans]MDZ8119844.1 Gfo/Idh/MocA family oxidoreductase [Pontiella agarivorans]